MRTALCIITLFMFVFFSAPVQAQGRVYVDSLLNVLHSEKSDTGKIKLLTSLAVEYNDINVDSAKYYCDQLLTLAEKTGWKEGVYDAYATAGIVCLVRTITDSGIYYHEKALKGYKSLKDSIRIAESLANLASAYKSNNELSKALKLYFDALTIYKKQDYKDGILVLYSDIGELYSRVDETDKAKEYYQKALELNKELGVAFEDGYIMLNIASLFFEEGDFDNTLKYCDSAISIFRDIDNSFYEAVCKDIAAEAYIGKSMYNEAMKYFIESGLFYTEANDRISIAVNYLSKANVHLQVAKDTTGYKVDKALFPTSKRANYDKAVVLLELAKEMNDESDLFDMMQLAQLYELLSDAYESTNNPAKALSFFKKRVALTDSIVQQDEGKKVAQLDSKRELEIKNKEIELHKLLVVKKRNERVYLIAGILLMLIVLGIVYKNYRQRGVANKLLAEEKHKSEELLLNILPEEVAEELKEKGSANATHFDEVTVLFTDFVNFSKASERMGSQELVDELHACFKAFDEIVVKHHIEKIKTIGDAYLAVSGLPVTDRKHAENVVEAAKEILGFMKSRRAELGDKTFEIRIGVHSGDVVAGIVGVKKFAYDIWGDTVNTAARMEQKSQPGKINISQTTYELVKDRFSCTYRGELEAKNKGKLKMYFVEV